MPLSNLPGGGDHNIFTYVLLLLMSLWGGLVNYLSRMRTESILFRFLELFIDTAISCFAGFLVGIAALSMGVSPLLSMAIAGVAGHAGCRTLFLLDRIFIRRLKSFVNEDKP